MHNHQNQPFLTQNELTAWLIKNNLPINLWGKGYAKTVEQLFLELQRQECFLEEPPPKRILTVVQIIIQVDDLILVELAQELNDQRQRKRCMPPSEKMKPGEDWRQAAIRCLDEELSMQEEQFLILSKDCTPQLYEKPSQSYPGLISQYHLYRVFVRADHLPQDQFWTMEKPHPGQKQAVKRHLWGWTDKKNINF